MKSLRTVSRYLKQFPSTSPSLSLKYGRISLFSTTTDKEIIPDEFFDENVEAEKEFCDISMTLIQQKGLEGINTLTDKYSWTDLSKFSSHPVVDSSTTSESDPEFLQFVSQLKSYKTAIQSTNADKERELEKFKQQIKSQFKAQKDIAASARTSESVSAPSSNNTNDTDLAAQTLNLDPEAFSNLENSAFFTPHELNSSMGHSLESEDLVEEGLENFIPNTDPNKFKSDEQGLRHCPGGMQRRGREPGAPLRCHLLDLDRLNPIDITNLKRFLSFDGEILSKKLTGLCARCQRQVARTVKTSRSMGILPHLGYVHLTDLQPSRHNQSFHKVVRDGGKRNKPILSKLIPVR